MALVQWIAGHGSGQKWPVGIEALGGGSGTVRLGMENLQCKTSANEIKATASIVSTFMIASESPSNRKFLVE